ERSVHTGSAVASEMNLLQERLQGSDSERRSVIPLLLEGKAHLALPPMLEHKSFDFRQEHHYPVNLFNLVFRLYNYAPAHPESPQQTTCMR
ncbi:MAG TPA: hypothetical protein VJZ27_06930, partial [Aggregatilineales bacterium]|nr:hypothetical protein [Aggregatilineales bacterium]